MTSVVVQIEAVERAARGRPSPAGRSGARARSAPSRPRGSASGVSHASTTRGAFSGTTSPIRARCRCRPSRVSSATTSAPWDCARAGRASSASVGGVLRPRARSRCPSAISAAGDRERLRRLLHLEACRAARPPRSPRRRAPRQHVGHLRRGQRRRGTRLRRARPASPSRRAPAGS